MRANHVIAVTMANTGGVETLCTRVFPAAADQVAEVRKVVGDAVAGHVNCHEICLLASELATNSIRHSGSRFVGLVIDRMSGGLRVAIVDEGRTGLPSLDVEVWPEAEGGRGMRIIEGMAGRWGIVRRPGIGMAVWFEYAELLPATAAEISPRPASDGDSAADAAATTAE